jgi:hypothetical protein
MTGSPIGSSQRTFVLYMHSAQADPLEVLLTEGVKSPYSTLAAWPDGHPLLPPLRTVASTDSPQLVKTLMLLGWASQVVAPKTGKPSTWIAVGNDPTAVSLGLPLNVPQAPAE